PERRAGVTGLAGRDTTGPAALLSGLPGSASLAREQYDPGSLGLQIPMPRGVAGRREPGTGWDAGQIVLAVQAAAGANQLMSPTLGHLREAARPVELTSRFQIRGWVDIGKCTL